MRKTWILGTLALLAIGVAGYTYLRSTPSGRSMLADAIEAHGGEANILRTRTGRLVGKGFDLGPRDARIPFAVEEVFQAPDQFKRVVRQGEGRDEVMLTFVAPAGKCWIRVGGKTEVYECDAADLENVFAFLPQLVEIHKSDVPLTPLGEERVRSRPALGYQADSKDWGKVSLYFDKESKRCVKLRKRLGDDDAPATVQEMVYGAYKDIDGVWLPMTITMLRDGKTIKELRVDSVQLVDRFDAGVFTGP